MLFYQCFYIMDDFTNLDIFFCFFIWNLQAAISIFALLFIGKLLEPIWGSKEFVKFILVVNFLTYVCVFITAIAFYYAIYL